MRTLIGRGMARSIGQVAVSVVATLIATQIYHGLGHRGEAAAPDRGAALTTGGKYDTRIAGAEMPPLPEPAKPALSIVNWAITPMHPTTLIDDIAWGQGGEHPAPLADPVAKPARREVKRVAVASPAVQPAPVIRPAALDLQTAPGAILAAHASAQQGFGLWSMVGATAQSVVALGGSVASFGGSTLSRLIPDRR